MLLEMLQFHPNPGLANKNRILPVHNLNLGEGFGESAYSWMADK